MSPNLSFTKQSYISTSVFYKTRICPISVLLVLCNITHSIVCSFLIFPICPHSSVTTPSVCCVTPSSAHYLYPYIMKLWGVVQRLSCNGESTVGVSLDNGQLVLFKTINWSCLCSETTPSMPLLRHSTTCSLTGYPCLTTEAPHVPPHLTHSI